MNPLLGCAVIAKTFFIDYVLTSVLYSSMGLSIFSCLQYLPLTNKEARKRRGVENLEHRLRKMGLRWFGQVKGRDAKSILGRLMKLEVEGTV